MDVTTRHIRLEAHDHHSAVEVNFDEGTIWEVSARIREFLLALGFVEANVEEVISNRVYDQCL